MKHQLSHLGAQRVSTNTEVKTRRQKCINLKTCGLTHWAFVKTKFKFKQNTKLKTDPECNTKYDRSVMRYVAGVSKNVPEDLRKT